MKLHRMADFTVSIISILDIIRAQMLPIGYILYDTMQLEKANVLLFFNINLLSSMHLFRFDGRDYISAISLDFFFELCENGCLNFFDTVT